MNDAYCLLLLHCIVVCVVFLVFTAQCYAECGIATASHLYVCPFVRDI